MKKLGRSGRSHSTQKVNRGSTGKNLDLNYIIAVLVIVTKLRLKIQKELYDHCIHNRSLLGYENVTVYHFRHHLVKQFKMEQSISSGYFS